MMNNRCLALLIAAFFVLTDGWAQTQVSRQWVFLNERDQSLHTPRSLGITLRALQRRAKVLPPDRLIDEYDLPPAPQLLEQIRSTGARIRTVSRWLNAVSVEATSEQLIRILQSPGVERVQEVGHLSRPEPELTFSLQPPPLLKSTKSFLLDYGASYTQLNSTKVIDVHSLAIDGTGVLIGLLDDGFNNHRIHPALKDVRILAEYDFVQRDSSTVREPNETPGQGNHGQGVLSSIAGFHSGSLIGAAFGSTYVLAKTEDISREVNQEEDNYVEGLEWMERLGVDIASSSLGYRDFDAGQKSYTYSELNGRTSIVAQAASVAARKGVLLCTAMGNEGFQTGRPAVSALGTLVSPADADSILGVGATSSDGILAAFSGTGPTSDGRIKPDIVAQGTGVYWAAGTASYGFVSGTSASTPLVAGVAALVLSARPDLTPMQVREALLATTLKPNDGTVMTASFPNNYYGWGRVNAIDALLYYGPVFSNRPLVYQSGTTLVISTFVRSSVAIVADSVFLYYQSGPGLPFERIRMTPGSVTHLYQAAVEAGSDSNYPRGYFSVTDASGRGRRHPHTAPDSVFNLRALINTVIPGYPQIIPSEFILHPNYPNPFNGETTILLDAPSEADIELAVFNLLGQRVRLLHRGRVHLGTNPFVWNGRDDAGAPVTSGMYLYRLTTPSGAQMKKMLYVK